GAVAGAVHQRLAVHTYRVAVARDRQGQLAAVAGERPIYRPSGCQPCRFLWAAMRAAASICFRSARKARTVSSTFSLKETFPAPISRSAVTAALLVHATVGLAPPARGRARSAARMQSAKWLFTRSRQSSTVTRAMVPRRFFRRLPAHRGNGGLEGLRSRQGGKAR